MGKYIVEDRNTSTYEKNYKMPLVNIIPGIVWSVPVHQKFLSEMDWAIGFGICIAFIIGYCVLSYIPIISIVPCVAGAIIFTGLFWVFADYIGNDIGRIVVKVLIAAFFGFMELAVFANATVPWLDDRRKKKPRVYKVEG